MSDFNEQWYTELTEETSYQTGSTKPPKNRNPLVAIFLIGAIFLCGLVSAFALFNIQLFSARDNGDIQLGIYPTGTHTATTAATPEVTAPDDGKLSLELHQPPEQVENVPQTGGLSLQEIYAKTIYSVVSITTDSSSGTGVVLSEDGYLLTNYHLVSNSQWIHALLTDGRELPAAIVGMDTVSDLAVLYIDAENLVPAQFGDSSALRVGDLVVTIGDPLGAELRGTMTDGIISAINRDVSTNQGWKMSLLQTNATLNSGNSGGPLINCFGQVVGINATKLDAFVDSSNVEGLGFAIPSVTVKEIVDQLISQGYVSGRPYLGVTAGNIIPDYQKYYHLPDGIRVTKIKPNSPCAGKVIMGDIITALDQFPIKTTEDLVIALDSYVPGDTVSLTIYRNGKYYTYSVTLGVTTSS